MPLELGARQMKNYIILSKYIIVTGIVSSTEKTTQSNISVKNTKTDNKISERQCGRNCFQCYNPELNFNSPEQDQDFESYENVHDFQCNYDQEQYETPHQLD